MTYNTYQIEYKIVGVVIKKYIDTVVGSKNVYERAMQIRRSMCCGLEIYLVKLRNIPIRKKAVYQELWI